MDNEESRVGGTLSELQGWFERQLLPVRLPWRRLAVRVLLHPVLWPLHKRALQLAANNSSNNNNNNNNNIGYLSLSFVALVADAVDLLLAHARRLALHRAASAAHSLVGDAAADPTAAAPSTATAAARRPALAALLQWAAALLALPLVAFAVRRPLRLLVMRSALPDRAALSLDFAYSAWTASALSSVVSSFASIYPLPASLQRTRPFLVLLLSHVFEVLSLRMTLAKGDGKNASLLSSFDAVVDEKGFSGLAAGFLSVVAAFTIKRLLQVDDDQ